ncbi:hypothetical protein HMPREF3291_06760 [Bacillus sp. HMSC76G11]|nr:hypothetical protein HMPREF3291_06760 [Bacillus sp. HMSC76G11]
MKPPGNFSKVSVSSIFLQYNTNLSLLVCLFINNKFGKRQNKKIRNEAVQKVCLRNKCCPFLSAPGTCFPRSGLEPPRHACGVSNFPLIPAGIKFLPLQSTQDF